MVSSDRKLKMKSRSIESVVSINMALQELSVKIKSVERNICSHSVAMVEAFALELEILLTDEILREVPMRHFVYLPKGKYHNPKAAKQS